MSETDISDETLAVTQGKTKYKLRIRIEGELEQLIRRIKLRKSKHKVRSLRLIVNEYGRPQSRKAIEERMKKARAKAIKKHPGLEEQSKTISLEIYAPKVPPTKLTWMTYAQRNNCSDIVISR